MNKLRVLLADDHSVVRQGLRSLITTAGDMEVVGETGNGAEVEKLVEEKHPDLLVLDLSLPGKSGLEVTREMHIAAPWLKILILTVHEQIGYLRMLFSAGASGYVLKLAGADELMRAIRTVGAGATYVDPIIAGNMLGTQTMRAKSEEQPAEKEQLSKREQEVLSLIARGYGNKEISQILQLSIKTIETYKARAMEKLGLASRVEIIRFANQVGWLEKE